MHTHSLDTQWQNQRRTLHWRQGRDGNGLVTVRSKSVVSRSEPGLRQECRFEDWPAQIIFRYLGILERSVRYYAPQILISWVQHCLSLSKLPSLLRQYLKALKYNLDSSSLHLLIYNPAWQSQLTVILWTPNTHLLLRYMDITEQTEPEWNLAIVIPALWNHHGHWGFTHRNFRSTCPWLHNYIFDPLRRRQANRWSKKCTQTTIYPLSTDLILLNWRRQPVKTATAAKLLSAANRNLLI